MGIEQQILHTYGKTIVGCCKTKNDAGTDVLHISFSDGSSLIVQGFFNVKVLKPNIG